MRLGLFAGLALEGATLRQTHGTRHQSELLLREFRDKSEL
jgi:hypothetical protein